MRTDESEKERVGKKARIMKAMRALKAALDEDDSTAKKAGEDDLDDETMADLDEEDAEDDSAAAKAKKAKRAKAKRAEDDELDEDQLDDDDLDEEDAKRAYDEEELYQRSEMQKFRPVSQQSIPRIKPNDIVSGRELVARAKRIALREGLKWRTLSGREEAFLLAAKEIQYRGPRV